MSMFEDNTAPTQSSRTFKKSDAFLNLEIITSQVGPDGEFKRIRVQKGIGLDADSKLGRTLINAAAKAEANGETLVLKIEGTVKMAEDESSEYDL